MGPDGWSGRFPICSSFCERLRESFPGVPLGMLGFSLGSFLLRDALCRGMAAPAGVILAGTGTQPGTRCLPSYRRSSGASCRTTPAVRHAAGAKLSLAPITGNCARTAPGRTGSAPTKKRSTATAPTRCLKPDISAALFASCWTPCDTHRRKARACELEPYPNPAAVGADDPVGAMGSGVGSSARRWNGQVPRAAVCCRSARHDIFHEEAGGAAARPQPHSALLRRYWQVGAAESIACGEIGARK